MSHDDEEDVLARVDLHAWRVPPPLPLDRPSLVARVLSPAAAPRRPRTSWMLAALAFVNILLAALIVIVISQWPSRSTVGVQPGGGGSVDAQSQALLRRLEQEQRELERRLTEVQQLRRVVEALTERVEKCEVAEKDDSAEPKPRRDAASPPDVATCDEVSCVLTNYEGMCCTKFRKRRGDLPVNPFNSSLPERLKRAAIVAGIAQVRAEVSACGRQVTARRSVKVKVRVSPAGHVESATVDSSVDLALAHCVIGAMSKATFEPTQQGGSFSYPFTFVPPAPLDPLDTRNP